MMMFVIWRWCFDGDDADKDDETAEVNLADDDNKNAAADDDEDGDDIDDNDDGSLDKNKNHHCR